MNNKAVTLSLGMAVLAIFFVQSYVESIENRNREKFGTEVLIVRAKKNIAEQETVNETHLELAAVPKEFVEPSVIQFPEGKKNDPETKDVMKSLVGMVAIVPIREGEQLAYNKLSEPGIRTGLSPQVAPGKRAIAIPITEITGVAKLVKPGDRVDLIAVVDLGSNGGKKEKVAKTLFQDVVVLSVGRNVANNLARKIEPDPFNGKERVRSLTRDDSFASVTVEVDPGEAQALAFVLSSSENTLTLSLRNNDDTQRANLKSTDIGDILGADASRVQRGPARR